MDKISEADLILNTDGSIYHLNLLPGDLATTIITVGDPDRVPLVSRYFDSIELKKQKREFVTHTGYVNKRRISVISTGISTDNIDIVFNEIDALVNVDFKTRQVKENLENLRIVRVGTAGGLQADVALDSVIATAFAVGFDGLLPFYQLPQNQDEKSLFGAITKNLGAAIPAIPYVVSASSSLLELFSSEFDTGITATCGGFYAPQGRFVRARPAVSGLVDKLQQFDFGGQKFTNFEMETAGIYGLGRVFGHECCSLSAIVVNRISQQFSTQAEKTVDKLIQKAVELLAR